MKSSTSPLQPVIAPLPWKVVYQRYDFHVLIGTPAIIQLGPTSFLFTCDGYSRTGGASGRPNAPSYVVRTTDNGATFTQVASLTGMFWGGLFKLDDAAPHVYMYGNDGENGNIVIAITSDNGETWTKATLFNGFYHTSSCKPCIKNGRFYKISERINPGTGRPTAFFVVDVAVNANLLNPANWTMSAEVLHTVPMGGSEWLEGNLVELPEDVGTDNLTMLFRVMYGGDSVGVAKYNTVTRVITVIGYHTCPVAWCKFTYVYCPYTKLFIIAGNDRDDGSEDRRRASLYVTRNFTVGSYRKVATLCDLRPNTIATKGMQYPDMIRDKYDPFKLHLLWRDASENNQDYHDASRISYIAIPNYLALLSKIILPPA